MLDPSEYPTLPSGQALTLQRKAELGQFMTPSRVAHFLASLFPSVTPPTLRVLDAGAGRGALTTAFLERWRTGGFPAATAIAVTAYEVDTSLRTTLAHALGAYVLEYPSLRVEIHTQDFIETAVHQLQSGTPPLFTHIILNPPYRKIRSDSPHRQLLRQVGIETVNLYTAFVALAIALLAPGGHLVAIIPRSFCNGVYYRPFRAWLLRRTAIAHIHLFESRTSAFHEDDVLQENVILRLVRGAQPAQVTVSVSCDATFANLREYYYPFTDIVGPDDPERFIHIPTAPTSTSLTQSSLGQCTLQELGLDVSTGPVVDFRVKPFLCSTWDQGHVPLLYPHHFTEGRVVWPKHDTRKPNAIEVHPDTQKWLYPMGYYTVVRRFSSKEECRRIWAHVLDPCCFATDYLGFENHLNIFHAHKAGLEPDIAFGLAVFLNSTAVDTWFRRFSGHTQVNATDLRRLRYPSRTLLAALGRWAQQPSSLSSEAIDHYLAEIEKQQRFT